MVYFIFDNPADRNKMRFLKDYKTKIFEQVYPNAKLEGVKQMFRFVMNVLSNTKPEDTIVFWYDFMGVVCWWLCKITIKKRNIVILNILLKDKDSIKNRVARFLYKKTLLDNNVIATVTSLEYGFWLNNLLGLKREFNLLHDIYYGDLSGIIINDSTLPSVFCGGRNGREWNLLIKIAKELPEVTFHCVLPSNEYESLKSEFSPNMIVKYDIVEEEFLSFLNESSLVVMPLDTQAPAGLIALFQAAMYYKMIITSNTVTTREYIMADRGVTCSNDVSDWVKEISYYVNHKEEAKTRALNFKSFLNSECSTKIYAKKLYEIVGGTKHV